MAKVEVRIRQAQAADFPHIHRAWLESFAAQGFARGTRPTVYRDRQHKLIRHIVEQPTVHALVVCPPDDDFTILAWGVFEAPNTVHYVFVKEAFRRLGLASDLLKTVTSDFRYTHRTIDAEKFLRATPYRTSYDPYSAFRMAA